jgi:acyl dehydratase
MARFTGIDDVLSRTELGTTEWQLVDQDRINRFAEVSGDRQWIHVDEERARREGPFGTTVAHGALTLAICTTFLTEVLQIDGVSHVVNGGFDKVRFHAPVPAGARLRGVVSLVDARRMTARARVVVRVQAELDRTARPACVADQILVLYQADR